MLKTFNAQEMDSKLNISEYKLHVSSHDHAMAVRMVCAISAILIALGIGGAIRWYDETVGSVVAPIVVFFIGLPAMIFGIWRVDQTYRRFPALVCHCCSCSLARAKATVIATGNCPNCGRKVLDDETIGT